MRQDSNVQQYICFKWGARESSFQHAEMLIKRARVESTADIFFDISVLPSLFSGDVYRHKNGGRPFLKEGPMTVKDLN